MSKENLVSLEPYLKKIGYTLDKKKFNIKLLQEKLGDSVVPATWKYKKEAIDKLVEDGDRLLPVREYVPKPESELEQLHIYSFKIKNKVMIIMISLLNSLERQFVLEAEYVIGETLMQYKVKDEYLRRNEIVSLTRDMLSLIGEDKSMLLIDNIRSKSMHKMICAARSENFLGKIINTVTE